MVIDEILAKEMVSEGFEISICTRQQARTDTKI